MSLEKTGRVVDISEDTSEEHLTKAANQIEDDTEALSAAVSALKTLKGTEK